MNGAIAAPAKPQLELSGPKLALALESLVAEADEHGGVELYVDALKLKAAAFGEALGGGRAARVDLAPFRKLAACMPTVRRRAGSHLETQTFPALRARIAALLDGADDTSTTDARVGAFCAAFDDDREHRWVRDLAAELLHNVDPERYPLMTRWVWDLRTNTGVLREIWHGEDIDRITIEVADTYETFLALREELAQYLAGNGFYRAVIQYVDVLTAQVYARYVAEQGGSYLRADFASHERPMLHVRRMLGLDGIDASGRTKVKAADGTACVVDGLRLPN